MKALRYLTVAVLVLLVTAMSCDTAGTNEAPRASFTVSPDSGDTITSFSFDASASSDPDGTVANYAWDFGDNNTASGISVTHSYAAAGTYTAELIVTDDDGATANDSQEVTVTLADPLTEDELVAEIEADVTTFSGLATNAVSRSATAASLSQLPPLPNSTSLPVSLLRDVLSLDAARSLGSGLSTLQDSTLPRGTYTYDANTGSWTMSPSDTLVLIWPFQGPNGNRVAELTIDWDNGSNTVVVSDGSSTLEVPTSASIVHRIDNNMVLDLALNATWYNAANCGASGGIFEPTSLDLNGSINEAGNSLSLDIGVVNSGATIATNGDITATVGSDSASLTWDVSVSGQRQRDSDCFTSDFDVSSGSIEFGASSTVGGQSSSLGFEVDFDNIVLTSGELESVDLSNGQISVDGQTAASFSGTLDDSNDNGVPGENVTVTVGGETTNLEAILMGVEMASTALRALTAF